MATSITHLGPYDISDVTDDILGLVYNRGVPVVIKQQINNNTVYAVLAKDKDVRIACVGCFRRDMRITDGTRCKKCASFVKHWDTKDGVRRLVCKESIAAGSSVVLEFDRPGGDLKGVSDADLLNEVKARGLQGDVAEELDDDALLRISMSRGIYPIFDARSTRLIHELRRQGTNTSIDAYYHDGKRKCGTPHCSDEVGADIIEAGVKTRQAKKHKTIHFDPKSVTDYT